MTLPSSLCFQDKNKEKWIAEIIQNLRVLDEKRKDLLFNFSIHSNPSVSDALKMPTIFYSRRSENIEMTCERWAVHGCLVTIDFMKRFPFVNLLNSSDHLYLLRNCHMKLQSLLCSTRCLRSGCDRIVFPDGSNIFPEESGYGKPSKLLNRVRSRLVGRLIELEITNDEYLLLSVLIFCNPGKLFCKFYKK